MHENNEIENDMTFNIKQNLSLLKKKSSHFEFNRIQNVGSVLSQWFQLTLKCFT